MSYPSNYIRVKIINQFDDLKILDDDWDELINKSNRSIPMLLHAWLYSYLETMLKPDEDWICCLAYVKGELIGILPLIVKIKSVAGFNFSNLSTPFNLHTLSGDMIIRRGFERLVVDEFIKSINSYIYPKPIAINLRGVMEGSPTLSSFQSRGVYFRVKSILSRHGSYIPIIGSFKEYHAMLGSNFKTNLRKAKNKLESQSDFQFKYFTGEDASPEKLEIFMNVEASGWKGIEKTAIRNNAELVSFYKKLAQRLYKKKLLEWHILFFNNNPIAINFAVRIQSVLFLIKIAYNEEYAKISPGNMLFLNTIEQAFWNEDISEINCITDMPWHNNWGMKKKKYFDIDIIPVGVKSYLFYYLPSEAKSIFKGVPGAKWAFHCVRNKFWQVK